jgi:hypothetical protein
MIPPPPGEQELAPETKVTRLKRKTTGIYRRRTTLRPEDREKIVGLLQQIWEESQSNTKLLKNKLQRHNDLMEGVRREKTFPLEGGLRHTHPLNRNSHRDTSFGDHRDGLGQ